MDRKLVSRACLVASGLIALVYLGDRVSVSTVVPVELFEVPSIPMFGLLVLMAALISVTFIIEDELAGG